MVLILPAMRNVSVHHGTGMFLDELYSVLHGLYLFGFSIRHLHMELFLHGQHQFDTVDGIRAQVLGEIGLRGDTGSIYSELVDDDLPDPLFHCVYAAVQHDLIPCIRGLPRSWRASVTACPQTVKPGLGPDLQSIHNYYGKCWRGLGQRAEGRNQPITKHAATES